MFRKRSSGYHDRKRFTQTAKRTRKINTVSVPRGGIRL